jgi:hypothetical protein
VAGTEFLHVILMNLRPLSINLIVQLTTYISSGISFHATNHLSVLFCLHQNSPNSLFVFLAQKVIEGTQNQNLGALVKNIYDVYYIFSSYARVLHLYVVEQTSQFHEAESKGALILWLYLTKYVAKNNK